MTLPRDPHAMRDAIVHLLYKEAQEWDAEIPSSAVSRARAGVLAHFGHELALATIAPEEAE